MTIWLGDYMVAYHELYATKCHYPVENQFDDDSVDLAALV